MTIKVATNIMKNKFLDMMPKPEPVTQSKREEPRIGFIRFREYKYRKSMSTNLNSITGTIDVNDNVKEIVLICDSSIRVFCLTNDRLLGQKIFDLDEENIEYHKLPFEIIRIIALSRPALAASASYHDMAYDMFYMFELPKDIDEITEEWVDLTMISWPSHKSMTSVYNMKGFHIADIIHEVINNQHLGNGTEGCTHD